MFRNASNIFMDHPAFYWIHRGAKKPLYTLHNAYVGMMKKVVGGKYTTLKQKCTSISGKINKMAESPKWYAIMQPTFSAPGNVHFQSFSIKITSPSLSREHKNT